MGRDFLNGQTERNIKVYEHYVYNKGPMLMIKRMDLVNLLGLMVESTLESGRMENNMEREK